MNISKENLKENLKRIQQILPTAYIASDKRVADLAEIYNKNPEPGIKASSDIILEAPKVENKEIKTLSINTDLPDDNYYYDELFIDDYYLEGFKTEIKPENKQSSGENKGYIDTGKKAVAIGAFNTKEQADSVKQKFPNDTIYVKKVTSQNGKFYFVAYSVNIPKEELGTNLERIKSISSTAYITSDKRVRELAELFNGEADGDFEISSKTVPSPVEKVDMEKEFKSTGTSKEKKRSKEEITLSDQYETISYGEIDTSKKAIALGAFFTQEDALSLKEKLPDDEIYIKKVSSKNNSYFVSYSVNIPKSELSTNLSRIKETLPTAYITSDKRVKELARIYNKTAFNENSVAKSEGSILKKAPKR